MKLLFDHNLAPQLVQRLHDLFPGTSHVSTVGLSQASDFAVWTHAGDEGFAIVTKDADFNDLTVVRGFPPKVIWIRLGNCTTRQIEAALRRAAPAIDLFLEDATAGVLELY